jgi:hypothetical protein
MSFVPALLGVHGLGIPELLILMVVFIGFGVLGTAFWIWMLVDCVTKESDAGNNKLAWILVIAIAHFLGAAIYFFFRRPQRIAQMGR